ncbi:PREDICTED: thyroid adenoma-associated protein homolog isoform X2 [Tarenaya hassleriana]|uniref:thyroid adenoma-associated protein homolog isoform X2 n=1 Tax=Tarenaya hassleriana TaxID=28532 RepID=UPI00053C2683|nr:PREDICTED: thyroid adenoma-associated protein homolog isoform X2 [Tarenaya hassleriana]
MSAKWRALQHRHRYTYSAVVFSGSFSDSLSRSCLSECFPRFYADILELVSLNSIYVQVSHAKNVAASFGEVLAKAHEEDGGKGSVLLSEAIRFYLEVLFMENSLPLHRTLVSALAKIRSSPRLRLWLGYLLLFWSNAKRLCLACITCFSVFRRNLRVCLEDEELGLFIAEGVFDQTACDFGNSGFKFEDVVGKVPFIGDICSQIRSFCSLNRLCLIRGILTAVSRDILNSYFVLSSCCTNSHRHGEEISGRKTILYDGILPELCNFCENPTDTHYNFHALTVLQICLQQVKASMVANLTDLSEEYDPMPENMGTRILKIIWNNLEDPLSQTVKQVHLIFDLFLDIQSTIHRTDDTMRIKTFLRSIANDLLRLGSRCKGRYVPLASLTRRLGAKTLLDMNTGLLFETANALIDDDVCCAATSFMKCFLEIFRDECWSSEGIDQGYMRYREHCLPPFLYGLASGMSKLRSNLNTYALPVLLELDVDSIFPLLAFISIGPGGEMSKLMHPELSNMSIEPGVEQKVAVLVSLLKVSRTLALLEGDIEQKETDDAVAFVCIKGIEIQVPVEWLIMALTHVDESIRVDAAGTLFLNPKTASLPSPLELYLMKEAMPLNMRSSSTGFQMKWTSLFRKFFSRVRTALERQYKLGSWEPLIAGGRIETCLSNRGSENVAQRAESLFKFMRWLSSFLFFSCYPSAPYKRKIMAMDLIQIMVNVWPIVQSKDDLNSTSPQGCLYPYNDSVNSPDSTLFLVGSIVDSWDRLRESSFRILLHFPTPLPGISSEDMVQRVISWAQQLVCSPRVRESDAGALALRLIFRKYVLDLGSIVKASTNVVYCQRECKRMNGIDQVSITKRPVIEYIKSLTDWLDASVREGEHDLSEACKNSFVHGVLLALRYTFEELDWNSDAVLSGASEMRKELDKLLELVTRITSLALWVVSSDAWYFPEDGDDMIDDDSILPDVQDEDGEDALPDQYGDKDSKVLQGTRQSEQIVMVGCWLAMKEVSLLLGTITRKIPLPSSSLSTCVESADPASDVNGGLVTEASESLLDLKQLEKIGDHFLEVLLKMKHNGAIDKTRAGFTALCNRLLCSNDPRLCKLTESWMEQLMERTVAKGQTVDDLLRRSAGIPAAFIAFFLSEPEGSPKKILPQALRWLIDLAKKPLTDPDGRKGSNLVDNDVNPSELDPSEKLSKIRDEGVVPTVHAFNVLRAAFNDSNLATDTSGFSAEAMIVSIRSFSSPYWEVRNSATLAYTALVRRMIGFLNVQKRESARRALSGLEFFHRYPLLHPFIYNELKAATDMLDTSGPSDLNLKNLVHPSLCPVLILLSRLKPSAIASETGDDLDPLLFMPFIKKCSTQCNLRVRVLASQALTGLVSNEKLPTVLFGIASDLPIDRTQYGSFNFLHGILLQLGALLDINCRSLTDSSKKDQLLGQLLDVLSECKWMASPILCPCPILNASFLRVLDRMLSIGRTCSGSKHLNAIYTLLLDLSANCLDAEASYGFSYYDPTIAELREQAAVSYFSCVFQPSNTRPIRSFFSDRWSELEIAEPINGFPDLNERLICSLSDPSYEVRLSTLKWLLRFLKSEESNCSSETSVIWNWAKTELQVTLLQLLGKDKSHRCENYILRILCHWNLLMFRKSSKGESIGGVYVGSLDYESVFQLWDKLTSLYENSRHAKTRGTLICCLAICVKRFTSLFLKHFFTVPDKCESEKPEEPRLAHVFDCLSYFVNLVKQQSSSSEQVNIRKASAEAMIASGLLEQAELIGSHVSNDQIPTETKATDVQEPCNRYAFQVLEMWFTCIKLLEDEDDVIRQELASDVQKCFSSSAAWEEVPTQVEKVIELSFGHLSSVFGHWNEYFHYLAGWVFNAATYTASSAKGGDLVRQVFDKEIDNHHEEKLLISQLCCHHLQNLAGSSNRELPLTHLLEWRAKFRNQLLFFANDHVGEQKGGWLGGIGNHKDSFLPLYGNLLGFYSLSFCVFGSVAENYDRKPLLSDMEELGTAMKPFLRNPLVSNIFRVVIRLHEKSLGMSVDDDDDGEVWDGFDPFFLLR